MKESHGEGVASHTDPESCVTGREDGREALAGERAGRVCSRERTSSGCFGHMTTFEKSSLMVRNWS